MKKDQVVTTVRLLKKLNGRELEKSQVQDPPCTNATIMNGQD